jgi:rhombotail lipoprotein
MMKSVAAILFLGVTAVGCSTSFNRTAMEEELQKEKQIVFDDGDILKIEQLRPQIQFPIRLAVVPPARVSPRYWQEGSSKGEHEELMALGEQLKKDGIASSFTVIPQILLQGSDQSLKAIRLAAARMGADAVLILKSVTDVDSYVNPLSVLNVTIIGLWLAPGHHTEALTMVEGMVIDNRNQFLYFAGSAEGSGSTFGPALVIKDRDAVGESRRNALHSFGEILIKEARQAKAALPGK